MTESIELPADIDDWIGRTVVTNDVLTPGLVAGLLATLDHDVPAPEPGSEAPQGTHWLLCPPRVPMTQIGDDGHPAKGGLLPPIPLPNRMWAASRIEFLRPLRVGDEIARTSTIAAITPKEGRSGPLVFVDEDYVTRVGSVDVVRERQTIVYRGEGSKSGSRPAGEARPQAPRERWDWRRSLTPDAVLLFRYSALTFNAHRIHFDLAYATKHEGYPGLVVHGPLTATLLLDLAARHLGNNALTRFECRAVRPAFAGAPIHLRGGKRGREVRFTAESADGTQVMRAKALTVA
ncbi:MAG: MaoC family dehydratase N-terminal domain-containing protein [Kiloniellaceae bacterium]